MFRRDNGRKQWGITLKKKGKCKERECFFFSFLGSSFRGEEKEWVSLSLSSCQKWADDGHKKNPLQMEMKKIIEGRKEREIPWAN